MKYGSVLLFYCVLSFELLSMEQNQKDSPLVADTVSDANHLNNEKKPEKKGHKRQPTIASTEECRKAQGKKTDLSFNVAIYAIGACLPNNTRDISPDTTRRLCQVTAGALEASSQEELKKNIENKTATNKIDGYYKKKEK